MIAYRIVFIAVPSMQTAGRVPVRRSGANLGGQPMGRTRARVWRRKFRLARCARACGGARNHRVGRADRGAIMNGNVLPIIVLTSFFAVVGCTTETIVNETSSSQSAAMDPNAGSFCDVFCGRFSDCDSSSDLETCVATCTDEVAPTIDKVRPEVVTDVRKCWAGADCREVLSGFDHFGACIDEAAAVTSPGEKTKTFCDVLGESLSKCDSGLDRAECLEAVKVYSDERIDVAGKCVAKSCSAIMPCVEATLR